ncbi:MAG: VOC family protein [Nitrososphaerales archaeon]
MKSTFTYCGIRVSNLERSISFYRESLGMTLTHRMKIPETRSEIALFKTDGSEQVLDHLAFKVDNLMTS